MLRFSFFLSQLVDAQPRAAFPSSVAGFPFGSSPKSVWTKCERAGGFVTPLRDAETNNGGIRCEGNVPIDPFGGISSIDVWFCPGKKSMQACRFNLTFSATVTTSSVIELLEKKYGPGTPNPSEPGDCEQSGSWWWQRKTKNGNEVTGLVFVAWLACENPEWRNSAGTVSISYSNRRAIKQFAADEAKVKANF